MGCGASSVNTKAIDLQHSITGSLDVDFFVEGSVEELAKDLKKIALPRWTQEAFNAHYRVAAEIRSGAFARVFRGEDQSSGRSVAIKVSKQKNCEQCTKEARILLVLANEYHPHVTQLYHAVVIQKRVHLVTQWADYGDLYDLTIQRHQHLEEPLVQHLMHQLVDAVRFCHQNSIAHLDIKPENLILVDMKSLSLDEQEALGSPWAKNYPFVLQLIDWGEAVNFSTQNRCYHMTGTVDFVSPEILNGDFSPAAADCWSLGVTMYTLLTDTRPFEGPTREMITHRIQNLRQPFPLSIKRTSTPCVAFLMSFLRRNELERATILNAFDHVWLQDYRQTDSVVQQLGPTNSPSSTQHWKDFFECTFPEGDDFPFLPEHLLSTAV